MIILRPLDGCAVICIKVGSRLLEFILFTNVDHWLTQAFRITSFPICTVVIVREISNDKRSVSDLNAHYVVNNSGLRDIFHAYEVIADTIYGRFHNIVNKGIKLSVVELHSHETVISIELTTAFRFVLIPSCKSKVDLNEICSSMKSYRIPHFNDTVLCHIFYELIQKLIRGSADFSA